MGSATPLRQLLRSLCHNTQWKYAVFWKLKHRSRMLLTWEDAYCDYPKPRDPIQLLPDSVCFNDTAGVISFGCGMDEHGVTSAAYSIGLAVANMSCLLYALGEGIVGKVAFTGRHSWISAHEISSNYVPKHPEEWHLQFAAGIKTILLVPVPQGVVQLGSLENVIEDLTLVAYIKDLFNTLQNAAGNSLHRTSSGDFSPSSPHLPYFEDFSVPSTMNNSQMNRRQPELLMHNGPKTPDTGLIIEKKMSTINPNHSPLNMIQDNPQGAQRTIQHLLATETKGRRYCLDGNAREAMEGVLMEKSLVVQQHAQNQIVDAYHLEMTVDMPEYSCFEEELQDILECNAVNPQISAERCSMSSCFEKDKEDLQKRSGQVMIVNSSNSFDFHSLGHKVDQTLGNSTADEMDHNVGSGFLSFPADSELHEALGLAFQKGYNTLLWDPVVSGEDGCSSLGWFCQASLTAGIDPSAGESDDCLWRSHGDEEHLLDAVVASVYGASEENVSNRSNNIRSPSSPSGQFAISCQTQKSEGGALAGESASPWSFVNSGSTSQGAGFAGSPTGSSSRATSILIDDYPQKTEMGSVQSKRGIKMHQGLRRKTKAGDIQKPRPRDRQLIQDRVKELRELVPNGTKCSIDSLLERTIKHMLFLRNVTSQAEKLKQCKHPKATGEETSAPPLWRHQRDGTWAFELGGQPGICPIIVENLDQPGHMLVEMLCEEYGLFLEIAQVIRHLELTILKGVMENRCDKIWAHFIVEASRGFQRMDILFPLMQLLQRSSSRPIPSKF